MHFFLARAAGNAITTFQEHKLRPGEIATMKEAFGKNNTKIECGPSDQSTEAPSAGVGMAVRNDIIFMKGEKRCEAFKLAYEAGRADKYLVDLRWEQNLLWFVIYGVSGGSDEAKEETAAIAEAIQEEIGDDTEMPVIIQGDVNRTPRELAPIQEMIEEDAWTDRGNVASWWRNR